MSEHLPTTETRTYPLARVMFWLAFLDLLVIAGIVHRDISPGAPGDELPIELAIMLGCHCILGTIIALETWIAVVLRDRVLRPLLPTIVRAMFITIVPPMRMGMPCPFTGKLWLPFWGWCDRGKPLEDRLERGFHKPMLVFALLILPALGFQFLRADEVKANPSLELALQISVGVIWVAFAFEFIIKVSAIRKPFVYSKERWLDLAIVLLPMLEFMLRAWADAAPLARLLRLTRAVAPEQLARMGQIYRLRGLMMKGWRAVLVLRVVAKLTGNTLTKQLRTLELQIAERELALNDLRAQADVVRAKLAEELAAAEREERERDPSVQPTNETTRP